MRCRVLGTSARSPHHCHGSSGESSPQSTQAQRHRCCTRCHEQSQCEDRHFRFSRPLTCGFWIRRPSDVREWTLARKCVMHPLCKHRLQIQSHVPRPLSRLSHKPLKRSGPLSPQSVSEDRVLCWLLSTVYIGCASNGKQWSCYSVCKIASPP